MNQVFILRLVPIIEHSFCNGFTLGAIERLQFPDYALASALPGIETGTANHCGKRLLSTLGSPQLFIGIQFQNDCLNSLGAAYSTAILRKRGYPSMETTLSVSVAEATIPESTRVQLSSVNVSLT